MIKGSTVKARDKSIQEREEKRKLNLHNHTIKGDAQNVGIIGTNAARNIENLQSEKKEKEVDFELRLLLDLLDDHIRQLEHEIKEVKARIVALEKLRELLKDDKLDFSNVDHLLLLQQAKLKIHEATTGVILEKLNRERIQLSRLEQNLNEAKKLKQETLNNLNSPDLTAAIRQLEFSEKGKVRRDITANNVDPKTAAVIDRIIGFNSEEQALLAAARDGKDVEGSNDRISFASTLDETPITTIKLKQVFENAQGIGTKNHISTLDVDPSSQFNGIPKI